MSRCPAANASVRCTLEEGHAGAHVTEPIKPLITWETRTRRTRHPRREPSSPASSGETPPLASSSRSIELGAPPAVVEAGAPGAREEVRAYAERIRQAWALFWDVDVRPWVKKYFGEDPGTGMPSGTVIGDVLGSDPAKVAAQKQRIALFSKINADRAAFEAYRAELATFSISGPSPSQAWQALQIAEDVLKKDRAALGATGEVKLSSAEPGALEKPGGLDQGLGSTIETAAKYVGGAIVLGLGLYALGGMLR